MIGDFIKNFGNFRVVDFLRHKIFNFCVIFFICFFLAGSYIAFFVTPDDEIQGIAAKMMYVHVPSAWACSIIYLLMTILSFGFLIYRNNFLAIFAYALAISGMYFTTFAIVTGMIWGKNTWGVYWAWDARLTSVLILMFFYIFHIFIFNMKEEEGRKMKILSIINLIGAINIPIIKFSVEFWNSLHQPASIIRRGGVAIDFALFYPLLIFFASFVFFTIAITLIRLHSLLLEKKINHLVIKNII